MAGGTGTGGGGGGGGLSANATSILCWTILPQLFTNALVSLFYRVSPSSRPTIPPNASPQHLALAQARSQSHHRRARVLLVCGYLAYSILSVYYAQSIGLEQNYYSLLGLSREAVEQDPTGTVKAHWRRLARRFHPDKVGKAGEAFFVRLRTGVETLENDNKRWAYERFGPEVHEWGAKLVTQREVLATGALRSLVWWAFALGSIVVFSFFRKSERKYNFWRYLCLSLCFALEFHLVMRSSASPTFSALFPNRLPFEHVSILRQIFISTSMAMSQLAPVLFPPAPDVSAGEATEDEQLARALRDADALKPLLTRLTQIAATSETEVIALQRLELQPLLASGKDEREVRKRLKEHMVRTFEDLQLKGNPATAAAWSAAVRAGLERERMSASAKPNGTTVAPAGGKTPGTTTSEHNGAAVGVGIGKDSERQQTSSKPLSAERAAPPVTLLVSPPASPKATPSPLELDSPATAADAVSKAGEEEVDSRLLPPTERHEFRLPTPPPDDIM
ncbi:hypothetical protein JCM10908_001551 [Rhodotorula pacifica]|uniref:J domain-containing protein n=1 Tax=Rhodotorula pacifica TaxID=1495444 RepID=UPI00317C94BF